jgi:DNA modification methylase
VLLWGDVLHWLRQINNESVNCVITSPPYYALRNYKMDGQLGLEPTYHEYLSKLFEIFNEIQRILTKDGTCWIVLSDTYNNNKKGYTYGQYADGRKTKQQYQKGDIYQNEYKKRLVKGIGQKSLLMIPQRFAIGMIDHGWILRNDLIWHKRNCMPSSAKDRFTIDYEHVFFFVKSKKYYFKTQYEPYSESSFTNNNRVFGGAKYAGVHMENKIRFGGNKRAGGDNPTYSGKIWEPREFGRNMRAVWTINTKPFKEAHFAVFPPALVERMIDAGAPPGGLVLDPFVGSGTTCMVAKQMKRRWIGIELNRDYIEIAKTRLS